TLVLTQTTACGRATERYRHSPPPPATVASASVKVYIKLTTSGGYLEIDNLVLIFVSSVMKILRANAGALTNFEVLDFLRSRGAAKDSTRIIVSVAQSEFKSIGNLHVVFDYLEQSAACNQTRERITEFVEKCKKYNLAKAEILNIVNIRPSSVVEIDPIIEECESRLGDSVEELVELVAEVLPAPPTQTESDDAGVEDKHEIPDGQQMDTS
ncbi:hypothetical protein HYC85_026825, partial [Camellia sinensis]